MKLLLGALIMSSAVVTSSYTSYALASAKSNCTISIVARAASRGARSHRTQELIIENKEIKATFIQSGIVREKYVGELSDEDSRYLCKHLTDSAFFSMPTKLKFGDLISSHGPMLSLQLTINGKYHSVYAVEPSREKDLAALDKVWIIAFSKPWNDHMRVKAYTYKKFFRRYEH